MAISACSTHNPNPRIAITTLQPFDCYDDTVWSIDDGELVFVEGSTYTPPHRSPRSIALLKHEIDGSYVLEVEAMQTGRDYGHRDLCFFFDWQDPSHYGYVHLATKADPRSHHIQMVDGGPRTPVTSQRSDGIDWGDGIWHDIRIERDVDTGSIKAFFDGTLVMEATDNRFGGGRVGLGSFDDQGRFRNISLRPLKGGHTPG
jgi:hypothetical protein